MPEMPNPDSSSNKLPYFTDESSIDELLQRNAEWSQRVSTQIPELFPNLASKQQPKILWIGCSDSRVPETTIVDLLPGELFVLRNIANVIANGDMSMLSCVQFAVEVLQVKHIVVCGHYGCGGVQAALGSKRLGLIDNWLRHIRDVRAEHDKDLCAIEDDAERAAKLVELNVLAQAQNVSRITYVNDAIDKRGLQVHALVYDVATGRLKQLEKVEDSKKSIYVQGELDLTAH